MGAAACAVLVANCETGGSDEPWVIPGPTVPSVVALRAPYTWDAEDELVVWTENAVSRGSLWIDKADSNGAIAIQFVAGLSNLILRGPDLDPPAKSVRAVRIRYQWSPASGSSTGSLSVVFDATNSPRIDLQLRNGATLKAAPGWTELEMRVPSYASSYTPLDVRYIYFLGDSANAGVLKLDSIVLLQEGS